MDQTRTVLRRHVLGVDDVVRGGREVDQGERALVRPALHLAAGERRAGQLPALAERLLDERPGDDELLLAVRRDDVLDLGVRGDGRVGDQGPGGRRPDQEGRLAGQRAGGEREADEDRGVDDRLVALGELVVGEAGAAARAPGGDAVVLDQQVLVEDLLQRPPHGLDVLGVHRAVGVVEVDPVAHPGRELGEGVGVPGHGLTALGVELGDAVRLDVLLAVEAELLLDRELDRQAVAVPAGLAADVVALHGAEAREDVLEDAGLDVVGAGHAVGGRRALVEDPLGAALGLVEALGEDLVLAPEVEHGVLQRGQVYLGGYLAVLRRCHVRASSGGRFPLPSEGREPVGFPRYHPPWPRAAARGPLIRGAKPVLLALCTWARPTVQSFPPTAPGDLHDALAPGLPPSPGRSWLRTTLLVPSTPLAAASVRGPGCGADRFNGRPRPDPNGQTRRTESRRRPARGLRADYPAGSWAQRTQAGCDPDMGRGESAACPVAAGLGSTYRPSTTREQDHNV